MRIAYLTVDEVNSDLARQWGAECHCEIVPLSPCDPFPNGEYDATIYDLDYLAPSMIQRVLTNLLNGSLSSPVVVHSYNLRPRQVNELQARGVFVRHRLERGILALLRWEVRRLRNEKLFEQAVEVASAQFKILDSNEITTSWASLQS